MPFQIRMATHRLISHLANFRGELRPKPLPPETKGFIAHVDASLVQQVFNVSERQKKPDVHHHGQADDFWLRSKVAKWAAFSHKQTLRNRPAPHNRHRSDKTCSRTEVIKAAVRSPTSSCRLLCKLKLLTCSLSVSKKMLCCKTVFLVCLELRSLNSARPSSYN